MKTPNEQYVESVARALHGKYGGAAQPSWTRVKDSVREAWCDDARELLEEIRPDLRYVTARGQDHHELSEALGVDPGELEWHKLLEIVRRLSRRAPHPSQVGEFARVQATTDVVRAVLRLLSTEYDDPHAHSDAENAYAEDMLLDAARRLVIARAVEAEGSPLAESLRAVQDADVVHSAETVSPRHPSLYPLHAKGGRIVPVEDR